MEFETKHFLWIIFTAFLLVTFSIALITDNPDTGTPNEDTTSISCEEYNLNAVECPWKQNQSNSNLSNKETVNASG